MNTHKFEVDVDGCLVVMSIEGMGVQKMTAEVARDMAASWRTRRPDVADLLVGAANRVEAGVLS